jgi:hypothetical protein
MMRPFLRIEEKDTDLLRKYGVTVSVHCDAFVRWLFEKVVPIAQGLSSVYI